MVKLQETKNRFFITVPKDLVKLRKWKAGQELAVGFNEKGNLEITEIKT